MKETNELIQRLIGFSKCFAKLYEGEKLLLFFTEEMAHDIAFYVLMCCKITINQSYRGARHSENYGSLWYMYMYFFVSV